MSALGPLLPQLRTGVPGPASRALVDVLARHECPAITARRARRASALGQADDDPFVWEEAAGANVQDADGNVFVDLTAGFGVALLGHRDPRVVAAVHAQADRLLHAMGDAWPDARRIALLARLAGLAPPGLTQAILGLSGADAIDALVKTALLASGRPGVVVFEGAYHGLALGVLGLQAYKPAFTDPFRAIVHPAVRVLPWGADGATVRDALADGQVGLVLVEPIQGRGGMRPAPAGWLAMLTAEAHAAGALLGVDEIQCGLGRAGSTWAVTHDEVVPDLLATGKALGGGLPLSACLGSREVMAAWGASAGEALHTQTFLGHPLGCAAALAVLDAVEADDLPARCTAVGARLAAGLGQRGLAVRGRGLMLGVRLDVPAFPVARALLRRGFVVLPAGAGEAEVLGLTPPACLTDAQQDAFLGALDEALAEVRA
ncbi:MAG: aspartate aminotransferase family protein [Alphaproteobacteria bacterium]|nr:aspartate aminotransferase family protein [Alphaproteobacteria bacterium]